VVLGPGISKSANPYYVRRALNAELVQRDLSHLFSGASDAICPTAIFTGEEGEMSDKPVVPENSIR